MYLPEVVMGSVHCNGVESTKYCVRKQCLSIPLALQRFAGGSKEAIGQGSLVTYKKYLQVFCEDFLISDVSRSSGLKESMAKEQQQSS